MKSEQGVVAFVGIGNMGWPMAANLLKSGYQVAAVDTSEDRVSKFISDVGGRGASSISAVGLKADVVITMLPTSSQVRQVLMEALPVLAEGTLVVEMSSGLPSATGELAAELAEHGIRMIDSPVSGGVPRAVTGELTLMVGGSPADVEAATPLLECMGNRIFACGQVGAGQAMKALNNLLSAGSMMLGIEVLLIGARFGLEPDRMLDVLNASTGVNNSTQNKFRQHVLSRTFSSGFSLDLMVKDVHTAMDVARSTSTVTPLAAVCEQLWAAAAALVGPGQDHTAVAQFSERLAGTQL